SWPRDASVGVAAFLAVGLHREACAFVEWLTTCAASGQHGIRVLYTLDGRAGSTEREVTDVSGYMGSLPVRIGNLAQEQHQLDVIAAEVRERGFNAELGSYVRAYCSPELDTAVLLLPLTGFDDPSASRVSATVEAIWRELGAGDPLLYRYPPGADGLPGREGA